MSLKMKLTSAIIMFMLAIATLVIGVLAAQTQSINMEGTINFEISDRSLYVKNVRLEDSDGTITEITSFMPGYINDGITLSLGTHTVSNTSFKIHFDLINTTSNTYEAGDVTLSQELQTANVVASASGTISPTSETIPEGETYAPITESTPISGTITLSITSTSTQAINLGDITITIEQYIPINYSELGYTFRDDSITGYTGTATDLVIPSSYKIDEDGNYIEDLDGTGTAITTIGANAFQDNTTLTSITLPETVISIGNNAFDGCTSLQSVDFNNCQITSIPYSAFQNCSSLITITIPETVTSIGHLAFSSCTNLKYNYDGEGKYLGSATNPYFALINTQTTNLTFITINQNCKIIAPYAFDGCANLQTVDFNNCQITTIPDSVFARCSSLTTITIPETVTSIERYAFYNCSSLTTITIPDKVTSIGESAFSGCANLQYNTDGDGKYLGSEINDYFALIDTQTTTLTSITINQNCKIIAGQVFSGCSSLATITIPETVTSIGHLAFSGCTNLQYNYDGEGKYLGSATNPYFALINTQTTTFTSITINPSCKIIADYAFLNCSSLQSVDFNNSQITSIPNRAFSGCTSLTTITIPETVTSISSSAFRNCSSLTTMTIPETVETIGASAFLNCTSLTTVVIESQDVYNYATNADAYGDLLRYAQTVKVPTSIVSTYDNSYLESETNFTPSTETIEGVEYTVFTKVGA